jgi:hypothetical protein
MNYQDEELLEQGKANMRGAIATVGVEEAAGKWADEYAGPFNQNEHAAIRGAILAAFEAGMLHAMMTHKETLGEF